MKLTIFRKSILGFSAVLVLVVALGGMNLAGIMKMNSGIDTAVNHNLATQSVAKDLVMDLLNARLEGKQMLISGDVSRSERIEALVAGAKERAAKIVTISRVDSNIATAKLLPGMCDHYLADMHEIVNELQSRGKNSRGSFIALLASDPKLKMEMDQWIRDGDSIIEMGQGIITRASNAADKSVAGVKGAAAETQNTGIIMISVALIVGIAIAVVMARRFANPIREISEAAKRVASGDNNVKVDIKSGDEVGELASAFNTMVANIRSAFDEVESKSKMAEASARDAKEAKVQVESERLYLSDSVQMMLFEMERFKNGDLSVRLQTDKDDEIKKLYDGFNSAVENIRSMIKEVSESVTTTATATAQISSSSEELASGAQEQSAQSSEVAAAVEEMTRTILDNSRNANKTAQVAGSNGELAKDGGDVVQQTVKKIKQIADVVSNSAATVQKLGKSSEQIGEIVVVINDIADQTNLLALNAAIEAARAGEQGRGFAVVADEVRKLAERTSQATKQIGEMIQTIQTETKAAVDAMNHGTSEMSEGIALADKAGISLRSIVDGTKNLTDMINQIAAASEEQTSTSEEISKNVESISSVSSESAQGVAQIARAADDLSRLTENLRKLVSNFKLESTDEFNFEEAKVAHKKWKIRLSNCISGREKIDETAAGAYKECKLGKWYYGDASRQFAGTPAFGELEKWHIELHQNAAKIARLCNENRKAEAETSLGIVDESSKHIVALLDHIKKLTTVAA